MDADIKENINKNNNNNYICGICFSNDRYFLCKKCFKRYNSVYQDKKKNLELSEESLSKRIEDLLSFNIEKSKKLNKKLFIDKYKQILQERIKQEENKIKKYEEENKEYEKLKIGQKDKNSRLNLMINSENNDIKKEENTNLFDSTANLMNSNIFINESNENNDLDKIKNEIFTINRKIIDYKLKYIYNLFEESFIKNKTIIKITDFFNVFSEDNEEIDDSNRLNFSILDTKFGKKLNLLKLEVFKKNENDIYLKRFNSFFTSMTSFLEKAYKKFKLKMPYKINYPKINANNFEYKIELKKEELSEEIFMNSNTVKGYHLLNINYEYLINYIFGDSKRLKYLFDVSIFLNDKIENLGSLKNIEEESKLNQKPNEYLDFEIL